MQISRAQRGFVRTGGFYGRYSGAAAEKKFFDTNINDTDVAATMTINNLTIVPEGNGESDRIGRKICVKKIHIKGVLKLDPATAAASTADYVICQIVQDTQTNGAAFVATDLIETDEFKQFRNLANSTRFKVLWKKVYTLRASGAAPSGAALVFGEDVRSLNANVNCSVDIEYDNSATTGAIGTVRTNNLYWVTQSSDGTCGITANARIRYTDR